MKIGISINEVLRDFIGQFAYTYDKYVAETKLTVKDVTSFDLIEFFKFENIEMKNCTYTKNIFKNKRIGFDKTYIC